MAGETDKAGDATMLWYYTTGQELNEILGLGELVPAAIDREKPAVWFSANQDWEPIANMPWREPHGASRRLSKDQTFVMGGGLARIGVAPETAPNDWKAFKRLSGISSKAAKEVYNTAVQSGSRPGQWFATFAIVPRQKWLAVEILEGDVWVARVE